MNRGSSSSHHLPSSPSPLRESHSYNIEIKQPSSPLTNPSYSYSFLPLSLYTNTPIPIMNPILSPPQSNPQFESFSYTSHLNSLDFKPQDSFNQSNSPNHIQKSTDTSTSPLPYTSLSSPSTNSSQPSRPQVLTAFQSQALEKRRKLIFNRSSSTGTGSASRFKRPSSNQSEEPSQALLRQRFRDRCRAHMERDRARALAKSRGDRGPDLTKGKGKKRNQELEPGKRGWNGRKETLRSSDLEDSDLEDDEQDFGEEIEMEGDWEAEDDELIRRIMLSEYRSLQKSREREGERALDWLNEVEIDYLEEELKREEEERLRNGDLHSDFQSSNQIVEEKDPFKTPRAKRWIGERSYPINSTFPSSSTSNAQQDQAALAQIEQDIEGEEDPSLQYEEYLSQTRGGNDQEMEMQDDFDCEELDLDEDVLQELENRAMMEKLHEKNGKEQEHALQMESLDSEMESL